MTVNLQNRLAEQKAEDVIREFGIRDAADIRLEDMAWELGIQIVDAPLDGADARLVRYKDSALIRVSTSLANAGRRRFSIGHEIGHYLLNHMDAGWLRCSEGDLHDLSGHQPKETQANVFAAHLLMPTRLIQKKCEISPVNFVPIQALANEFGTSLTASALRFVELTPEACALVISEKGRIKWYAKSESFQPYLKSWGEELDSYSVAYDYFTKARLHERAEQVDISAWSAAKSARGPEEIWEHSVAIPSLGTVLTMLWLEPQGD